MRARLLALRDNTLDSGGFQPASFVNCRRGTGGADAGAAQACKLIGVWYAERKAEHRRPRLDHCRNLIWKWTLRIRWQCRRRKPQSRMHARDKLDHRGRIDHALRFVAARKQVQSEWLLRQRTDLL